MRFLLLCPVALLLLTAPAKTIELDSVEVPDNNSTTTESARSEPIDSSPPPATTTPATATPEVESASPSTELPEKGTSVKPNEPDPNEVRRLSRELAEAQADLKALKEEIKILDAPLKAGHSKTHQLFTNQMALAGELSTINSMLREAQDNLNIEVALAPQGDQCKPSESELAKMIDEEFKLQLDERKEEINLSYKKRYKDFILELYRIVR